MTAEANAAPLMVELTNLLPGASLDGWEIRHIRETSHQLYLIFDTVENLRRVETEKAAVQIYLHGEQDGRPVLGESGWTAHPGDDYAAFLEQARDRAGYVANPPFTLPGPDQEFAPPTPLDPAVRDNPQGVLWQARTELNRAVEELAGVELASAEIYVQQRQHRYCNHTGLTGEYAETEVEVQFALLASRGSREAESLGWRRARLFSHLGLGEMVRRYGRYALDGLQAEVPPSGTFPVVLGEEALDTLFRFFTAQASAVAAFQGWARWRPGEPVIAAPRGDRLTLTSDPGLPGGMAARPFDEHGLALRPVTFIADNILHQVLADKRYADYLEVPATGELTNLRVAPGSTPLAGLLEKGPVLHLLRFSTLEPNPVTGALSGEIRTGYLHRGGPPLPLKGGSLSGMLTEAFERATLSRETVSRERYCGPAGVRLEALEIAGD